MRRDHRTPKTDVRLRDTGDLPERGAQELGLRSSIRHGVQDSLDHEELPEHVGIGSSRTHGDAGPARDVR